MPYQFKLHSPNLLWVIMHGQLELAHAEAYFHEIWQTLDSCPRPTDMLVDGRGLENASYAARRRTEEVAHHPHLGNIAFVVREQHLLIFAPLARLVSGIGLFGAEHEALAFLRASHHMPAVSGATLVPPSQPAFKSHSNPTLVVPPQSETSEMPQSPSVAPPAHQSEVAPTHQSEVAAPARQPEIAPAPRHQRAAPASPLHRLTELMHGWAKHLESLNDSRD